MKLVGSRARGEQTPLSDWDFRVAVDDFAPMVVELPDLVDVLRPICKQWDRLSDTWCHMLLLRGPMKVDLIFDEPHQPQDPWSATPSTLAAIDEHFWDWALWIGSKDASGQDDLVRRELAAMHEHLLRPLGAPSVESLPAAIDSYLQCREALERRYGVGVPRDAESEVLPVLRALRRD